MRVVSLKLLFRVILIFTVKIADTTNAISLEDSKYCSNISGLLPISVVAPINYDIEFYVRLNNYKLLLGMSKITFLVRKRTKIIRLHSYRLEIDYQYTKLTSFIQFVGQKHENEIVLYSLKEHKICDEAQILILLFDESLYPGKYKLYLKFSYLAKQFGVIHYSFLTNNIPRLLITNIYQRNAIRGMFPCWDDPAVKASFNISISHPNSTEVFSNKPVLETTIDIYGAQKKTFHEILSMPTYLIGILIVDHLISKPQQMNINNFWHEEDLFNITSRTKTARFQLANTSIANLTSILPNIMQINFTHIIKKIDHVVLSTQLKSVGKPGLIVYSERDVAFNEKFDFPGRRLQIMLLIARELVQQVFDSDSSYSDTSLNQVLCLFYSYYAVSQMLTKFPVMDLFVVQHAQPIMDFDYNFARNFRNSKDDEKIDSVTYPLYVYKGVSLIRMLFHIVTSDTFRESMSEYVKNKTHDFWGAMQNTYHLRNKENYTISKIMDTWIKEEYYPEVYVQRDFNGTTAVCFLSAFNFDVTWQIPITYITQSYLPVFTLGNVKWLNYYQKVTISDIRTNDFILVNLQQIGYYRVNYNNRNWEKIALYLKFDSYKVIPVLNRAQLISDSYYFASKGELESTIFLDIMRYLKRETDFIPWYPMFNIILSMSTYLKYLEGAFVKDYILEILDGLLKNIGFEDFQTDEEGAVTSLRLLAKVWACTLGHKECMEDASNKLMIRISNSKMETDDHEIELWKNLIFCSGIKMLNITQWEIILNKAMSENDNNILRLLTCSENEDVIIHYLDLLNDLSHNKEIRWENIYYDIVKRHASKFKIFEHILDNFIKIRSKLFTNDAVTFAHLILNVYFTKHLDKIKEYATTILAPWTNHCLKCVVNHLILWQKKQMAKVISTFSFF